MYKVLFGLLALVGTGVIAWYLAVPPVVDAPSAIEEEVPETMPDEEVDDRTIAATGEGTFYTLLSSGASGQCTFTTIDADLLSSGTIWYASGRFAIESQTRVDGELYVSNMIDDGERMYIWSGTAAGTMALVMDREANVASTEVSAASPNSLDLNTVVKYDCEPWQADQARFVPPTGINFTDMNDIKQGAFEGVMRGTPEGLDF